mmetsp:Transcript_13209/g.21592  ORF Transcript_13209/g.21592 Transcript_13209/m.21592 type:complete len:240 (+) Transcript_13209:929-1648(+)
MSAAPQNRFRKCLPRLQPTASAEREAERLEFLQSNPSAKRRAHRLNHLLNLRSRDPQSTRAKERHQEEHSASHRHNKNPSEKRAARRNRTQRLRSRVPPVALGKERIRPLPSTKDTSPISRPRPLARRNGNRLARLPRLARRPWMPQSNSNRQRSRAAAVAVVEAREEGTFYPTYRRPAPRQRPARKNRLRGGVPNRPYRWIRRALPPPLYNRNPILPQSYRRSRKCQSPRSSAPVRRR